MKTWFKQKNGLESTMNESGKPFRKISNPKNRKNSKYQSEIAACKQAPFPFSHFSFKLECKKFKSQNQSLFRSTSCFGATKINTPIWLQKSWKRANRS